MSSSDSAASGLGALCALAATGDAHVLAGDLAWLLRFAKGMAAAALANDVTELTSRVRVRPGRHGLGVGALVARRRVPVLLAGMRSYDERAVDERLARRREPAPSPRGPLTLAGVMALQRSAGNQALARMLGDAPSRTRRGVEALAGMSLSDVDVVTDSAVPAALGAHAYADGDTIHLGPGQERHLAHEAWHVVQQRQGRVPATGQVGPAAVNDDPQLEREADRMGALALDTDPAPAALPLRPAPSAGPIQLKSTLVAAPKQVPAASPIAALSAALQPFFRVASALEQYHFHGLGAVQPAPYAGWWARAGSVRAQIDPLSHSKADGSNRNNAVIGPYGHFGAMERSIFQRQDLGNTYDGGHLVEHTLMEGQDGDVHGNLAPQENKNFNQGLMRGWESVPEWLMKHVDFTYDVEVTYSEDSYTRTGQQLTSAGVLPHALVSGLPPIGPVSRASLNALTITFPRWIPVNWKAAVTGTSGALLPAVTLGAMPSHFRNLKASVKAAEDHVVTVPNPHLPHRKRRNSGTLAGAIPGLASMAGGMYVLASANQYQASMFQPDPMDPSEQPTATTTPAGSVPAVIPAATIATNLLAGPFSAGAFFKELSKLGPSKGYDVSAKTASSHFKTLRTTLLKPLVGISKSSTKAKAKKKKGRMLVKNADEGHKLVVAILAWKQNNPKQKFNKLALMQAVAASQLPKDTRGLLLQLETDPNLTD